MYLVCSSENLQGQNDTIGAARDGCKDQMSEALYALQMLLSLSYWIQEATDVWKQCRRTFEVEALQ